MTLRAILARHLGLASQSPRAQEIEAGRAAHWQDFFDQLEAEGSEAVSAIELANGESVHNLYPRHPWWESLQKHPPVLLACQLTSEGQRAVEDASALGHHVDVRHLAHRWQVICPRGCTHNDACPWWQLAKQPEQLVSIVHDAVTRNIGRKASGPRDRISAESDLVDMHGHLPGIYYLNTERALGVLGHGSFPATVHFAEDSTGGWKAKAPDARDSHVGALRPHSNSGVDDAQCGAQHREPIGPFHASKNTGGAQ
jgi:hypothetical protein